MNRDFKILGTIVVAWNTIYLIWLAYHVTSLGYILLFAEFLIASLTYFLIFNHWGQSHTLHHFYPAHGSVDVFITTVNEPIAMLNDTISAASEIDYPNKIVYILDDGPRDEIEALAKKYGAQYLARRNRIDSKAGNLNFGLQNSMGEYILVIDADHVANPFIIKDLLGHFDDSPETAVVATRQAYLVPEGDFNHDVLFYQHMMAGKHEDNASISCGNGVFYRRSALKIIGGFQTWNLVEDLYTSYILHTRGFKTVYINQPYTYGTAPLDLANIYKQRGTWALDTLRMVFWHSPLFARGLKFWQRLHYIEIGYSYIVSAIAMPIVFVLPAVAVLRNDPIITDPITYLLLRIPSLLAILYFYYRLSDKMFAQMQYWASLFPIYMKALVLALIGKKVPYKVTSKVATDRRHILLVVPHVALIIFSFAVILWRIFIVDHALTAFTAINLMWACLMAFWFTPVIYLGFKRVNHAKTIVEAKRFIGAKYPYLFNGRAPRIYNPPLNLPVENVSSVFE